MLSTVLTKEEKIQKVKEFLYNTKMDATVNKSTVNLSVDSITPSLMLTAATKVLNINRGKEEPDDRDNLKYTKFLGMEDYVKEYITIDPGKVVMKAKQKMDAKKNLDWLHAGFFTPMTQGVIIGNSLSQNIEGHNPLDYYDVSHKVTKMGIGGITDTSAIPDESRQVHSSQFGFLDPVKLTESTQIGVTLFFTKNTRKGSDGKLYKLVEDKNHNKVWIDHQTLLNSNVEIPTY